MSILLQILIDAVVLPPLWWLAFMFWRIHIKKDWP